jgi:hypothetical protein
VEACAVKEVEGRKDALGTSTGEFQHHRATEHSTQNDRYGGGPPVLMNMNDIESASVGEQEER